MTDVSPAADRPLAAIDVGTNSVHMVIARPTPHGPLDVIARDKEKVRLGSGDRDMKTLDPVAVDRAVEAIDRFARIAAAHDAELVAVATSAVRESENPRAFLEEVRRRTGVRLEVIAGVEEARLIHLGAISAVAAGPGNHLVIDIGGGSTEVVIGHGQTPLLVRSLKLGHLRLTDGFMADGVVGERSGEAAEAVREVVPRPGRQRGHQPRAPTWRSAAPARSRRSRPWRLAWRAGRCAPSTISC